MKKSLSNLVKAGILGTSLLFANPSVTAEEVVKPVKIENFQEYLKRKSQKNYIKPKEDNRLTENLYMAMQNAYLDYNDLYLQTIPALNENWAEEQNPITKYLFESGNIELKYLLNIAVIFGGNFLSYKIDKTGKLATAVNIGLSLSQMDALIKNNKQYLKATSKLPKGMNFPIRVELFHLRY